MTFSAGMLNLLGGLPLAREGSFWFPPEASSFAPGVDFTFNFILWTCVVFFVGICGTTAYFVWKYRKRPGHKEQKTSTHNLILEATWSILPLALLMVMFGMSTYWYYQMITPPKDEQVYDITVRGQKWRWAFKYSGDPFDKLYQTPKLHVIKGQAYRLIMDSPDVIHSMYLPAFRVKQDCVPGRYNKLWFRPTMAGEFDLFCTEYCGNDHSLMITKVVVHEDANAWRDAIIETGDVTRIEDLLARGQAIYEQNCASCHTLDGSPKVGPSFKGIWGKTEQFEDGTSHVVDEEYVRESITTPAKHVVKGYPNSMTPFDFGPEREKYYDGIFALLKSLKDK